MDNDVNVLIVCIALVVVMASLRVFGVISLPWIAISAPLWVPIAVISIILFGSIGYITLKILFFDRD